MVELANKIDHLRSDALKLMSKCFSYKMQNSGVNRLNSVQKATDLKKKSKVGKMLRQQCSDHRFRTISALISTASPEKNG